MLTLEQLTKIFVRVVVDYNKSHYIKSYPLTEEMVRRKVKPIPCELWEYGTDKGLNTTRQINPKDLYFNLLPREMVTLDKEGVKLFEVDYTTKTPDIADYLNNKLAAKTRKVEIAYDVRCLKTIYLVVNKKYHELVPRKSQLMDRDEWDYKALRTHLNQDATKQSEIESIQRRESDLYIDSTLEEAEIKQNGKVITDNIRENREKDLKKERQDIMEEMRDVLLAGATEKTRQKTPDNFEAKGFDDIINNLYDEKD